MSLQETPQANRIHIGIFGKRNSGKSSLINAITNQENAVVSPIAGTTTDPVYKTMEIHGLGPCMLIDTAGFDDEGELGNLRIEKTRLALMKTDIAILLLGDTDFYLEKDWLHQFKKNKIPVVAVLNKIDILEDAECVKKKIKNELGLDALLISAKEKSGIDTLKEEMIRALPADYEVPSLTKHLISPKDIVLLVMPQDIQAPKGRLILPQVQTIRDLLDNKCIVMSTTTDNYEQALQGLAEPPKLIITDSQIFRTVYDKKPKQSKLTSFSVLYAAYKGDIATFLAGAAAIDQLKPTSKVLIAEACTHAPLSEDIGREKIPQLLRKKIGESLTIEVVSGTDFPENLTTYDLIIHCGACMFNRKYILRRLEYAKSQGVPICNYGIALAHLSGILEYVSF
jgi:[FeFe] hydrogenase H-cluster maturation GTPase HydF